jgi:hypothetical protein
MFGVHRCAVAGETDATVERQRSASGFISKKRLNICNRQPPGVRLHAVSAVRKRQWQTGFGPKTRRSAGVNEMGAYKHFDPWSFAVIGITLTLFLFALVTKGFTHDLLLEAGVFLVSVKLILLGYKLSASNESILQSLEEIHSLLEAQRPSLLAPSGSIRYDSFPKQ